MPIFNDQMQSRVAAVLAAQGVRSRRVAVGLSGGIDSVVLLDLLDQLRQDFDLALSAIHVNHGISLHAADWERFCGAVCAALGIPLQIERVKVSNQGDGVEAAARRLRYQAFASVDADFIALAHHMDDQAETLLLQLLRGAGAKGMAAMPELRSASPSLGQPVNQRTAILRPLLEVSRKEIAD